MPFKNFFQLSKADLKSIENSKSNGRSKRSCTYINGFGDHYSTVELCFHIVIIGYFLVDFNGIDSAYPVWGIVCRISLNLQN